MSNRNRTLRVRFPVACTSGAALAVFLLLSGCNALDFAPLATATKTLTEAFQVDHAPVIVVETFNGSIDLSPAEGNEVVVEVTKRASGLNQSIAEDALEGIRLSIVQTGDKIEITARREGSLIGNAGAAVVISAPPKAQLHLQTSNGRIICEGLQGGINATTSNGNVEVIEGAGRLDLVSANGNIQIEADDAKVTATTSNARIKFRGSLGESEQRFRTSNGNIELFLPEDCQFSLNASTSNAHIDCDFPIEREGKSRRTKLKGSVGEHPDRKISLSSSNGNIAIRKAKPEED